MLTISTRTSWCHILPTCLSFVLFSHVVFILGSFYVCCITLLCCFIPLYVINWLIDWLNSGLDYLQAYLFSWSYYHAVWSAIGIIMSTVCLVVRLWRSLLWTIHQSCSTYLNKWIGNTPFTSFNLLRRPISLNISHLLNHRGGAIWRIN